MNKNIKISLIIFVVLVGSSLLLSYKKQKDLKEKRINDAYEMFQPKEQKEVNFIAGDYFAILSPVGNPSLLLKLNLSPVTPAYTEEGARASLIIKTSDEKPDVVKLGGWTLSDDGIIEITLSGTTEEPFDEPEIMEFVSEDGGLKAIKYDSDIYNTGYLQFKKEILNIEPEGLIDVVLCGKEIKADNVVFGGVNFMKIFERIVRENSEADFCNNVYNISNDFFNETLGLKVREWRWNESGEYVSEKYGPVAVYSMSLYPKDTKYYTPYPFDEVPFPYKFDFVKNEVSMEMAMDGSFFKIGSIEESDVDINLRNLSVVEELKKHFEDIDEASDIQEKESNVWWIDDEGYSILVPTTESFFVAKSANIFSDHKLIPNQHFYKELAIAKQVFSRRGFVLDEKNSSEDILDQQHIDYIQAYKKGDELCVVLVNSDNTSLSISCGNTLKQAQAEQIPFIKAIEDFKPEYKNFVVRVWNQSGDFFQVGVGGRRAGSSAVIKKEDDSYRVLYISQEDPYCELIDGENIPAETLKLFKIGGCFTHKAGKEGYRRFEE